MVEEVVGHLLSQFHLYRDLSFRTIVLRPERQQHSADNQAEQAEEGQNCKDNEGEFFIVAKINLWF